MKNSRNKRRILLVERYVVRIENQLINLRISCYLMNLRRLMIRLWSFWCKLVYLCYDSLVRNLLWDRLYWCNLRCVRESRLLKSIYIWSKQLIHHHTMLFLCLVSRVNVLLQILGIKLFAFLLLLCFTRSSLKHSSRGRPHFHHIYTCMKTWFCPFTIFRGFSKSIEFCGNRYSMINWLWGSFFLLTFVLVTIL